MCKCHLKTDDIYIVEKNRKNGKTSLIISVFEDSDKKYACCFLQSCLRSSYCGNFRVNLGLYIQRLPIAYQNTSPWRCTRKSDATTSRKQCTQLLHEVCLQTNHVLEKKVTGTGNVHRTFLCTCSPQQHLCHTQLTVLFFLLCGVKHQQELIKMVKCENGHT